MTNQLEALFTIASEQNPLIEMQCSGPEVNEEEHRKLAELVDSHPEWNDTQAIEVLKQAGARFGPEAEQLVRSSLPFERLEPILGKIHLDSMYFEVRNGADPPEATLSWYVDFTAQKGRHKMRYYLRIEPFGGRPYILHWK